MKIAISLSEKNLSGDINEVFARCPYFAIINIENNKITKTEIIKNQFSEQLGQAGISVAQWIAEKGVEIVIANNIGSRAFEVLKQFGVDVYIGKGSVENILENFIAGKLKKVVD